MLNPFDDSYFMRQALLEAEKALLEGEVPVGAVVVAGNQIIGRGYNLTEKLHDVTAHAEIQAITAAANYLGAKYLKDCSLYVTLEPCPMCAGALYWSQLGKIIYGASDEKRGALRHNPSLFHPSTTVIGGVEEATCVKLMRTFFEGKR
ncbi:MAG: nucleoside deaminase [Flavobacteriales bacterium]|jgi:tRNA(adenine34) deaminase